MINGSTRLTGLLGSPVAHSISPMMHNESYRLLGLNYVYLCFETTQERLAETVRALKTLNARGFNCTMPVKMEMCRLADQLSPAAEMIGAVNTVVNDNGMLTGHNTDGVGYMTALSVSGCDVRQKKMTLLGAGGCATAIAVQAALDGVRELALFSRRGRSFAHAQHLTDLINARTDCRASLYDLADTASLRSALADSYLLTNATPAGMAPDTGATPLPDVSVLHEGLIVSDVIYNPRKTKLLADAHAAGCRTLNGLYMLLYQGAEAFRLWTGQDMPTEQIREKYFT